MSTTPSALAGGRICPTCRGAGAIGKPPAAQVCPTCGGQGVIQQQPIRVPFDLVLPNAVLTASQSGLVVTQQLDQDADLEVLDYITNSTGLFSFQIFDPSTGRALSNSAVNGENGTGTAQLPRRLVEPYVWARSSTLKVTFNDRSGGGNTVQLVFSGYKLYPRSNPSQGAQGAIVAA
jgi:hypothetical protein